jgi:hypothetical protein
MTFTLADLELPPDTLDGFTPEQIAEVVQAAEDGARARIGVLLGGLAGCRVSNLDSRESR